jgi:hypothetical protein
LRCPRVRYYFACGSKPVGLDPLARVTMHFIEPNEIHEWIQERAIDLASGDKFEIPGTSLVLSRPFGQAVEPRGQEETVVSACVESIGRWDECLLWVQEWGVWPSSENWPAYYEARGQQGERRSLGVAPGHLFGSGDQHLLVGFLRFVLENAWEAQLVSVLHGQPTSHAHVSHDEWVDVWAPVETSASTPAG